MLLCHLWTFLVRFSKNCNWCLNAKKKVCNSIQMLRFCFVLMNGSFSALCVLTPINWCIVDFWFFSRYFCFEMWAYLFIYFPFDHSNNKKKRERAEEVRNVCRFIYKLLFKCWSIIWSNVALWKIGFCILKSMMHVRDWCVQRIVHLVLFSLLYSFASRAWKVFVVFFQLHFICKMMEFFSFRDHVLFWNNFCYFFLVQCECINDFVYTRCGPIK